MIVFFVESFALTLLRISIVFLTFVENCRLENRSTSSLQSLQNLSSSPIGDVNVF